MAIHILFGNIMTVQLCSRIKGAQRSGFTKRCRQSLLANSALVYESQLAMSNQRSFKIGSFRFAAFVPKKIECEHF
jgi:hypothetical protein